MIHIVTLDKAEEWDRIVMSFAAYDVYYLSGYARGFYLHGDGEPLLIYYSDDKLRAVQVVMKRDIAQAETFKNFLSAETYFDFCTPYGYGGWITEGDGEISALMDAYDAWCCEHNIVSEFVRYHPQLTNPLALEPYYESICLGNTVEIPLISEQSIWDNLTSKNRNVIRKAQKNGLTVHASSEAWAYNEFMETYQQTMDRDQATAYYYFSKAYYESLCNGLKENSLVFYVSTPEGEIAAAAIILFGNGRVHYHLSGSKDAFRSFAPTNLLLYEVACWGVRNGYRTFHLGGGLSAKADSLYAFKKAFYRGEPLDYYIGKKITNPIAYQQLIEKRGCVENVHFFPQYRG